MASGGGAGGGGLPLIYHERQAGRFCALHALNSLLQGSYYNEVDLAQIALELDARERAFMAEGGVDSNDFLRFMAEESGNVADDGNYSVQVLSEAAKVYDIDLIPIESPRAEEAKANLIEQKGFICNLSNHWLTVLRVDGAWYDLNSFNKAPAPVTDFYLALFLESMRNEGYAIFVAVGNCPPPNPDKPTMPGGHWKYPAPKEVHERAQVDASEDPEMAAAIAASIALQDGVDTIAGGGGGGGGGMTEEEMLRRAQEESMLEEAMRLSMGDAGGGGGGQGGDVTPMDGVAGTLGPVEDPDEAAMLAAAIAASLANDDGAGEGNDGNDAANGDGNDDVSDMDTDPASEGGADPTPTPDAAAPADGAAADGADDEAVPMTVWEAPPEVGDDVPADQVAALNIRLPDGSRLERTFLVSHTIGDVVAFVGASGAIDPTGHRLVIPPMTVFDDDSTTLAEAGLAPRSALTLRKLGGE